MERWKTKINLIKDAYQESLVEEWKRKEIKIPV